jgi:anti-sigma factor RsiW
VTAICETLEPLISLHATGALEGEEADRLDAHLLDCPGCREELARARELLDLVRLAPVSAAESLALADLPTRTLSALRRRENRRGLGRRLFVGGAVAAALVLALLAPAFLRTRSPRLDAASLASAGAPTGAATTTAAAWEEPDPGTLWSETAVLDFYSTSSQGGTVTDAALAAYDDGAGI